MKNIRGKAKAPARRKINPGRPAQNFRFQGEEHYNLVQQAAVKSGLSVNAWIVHVTLQEARKLLALA